MRNRNRLHAIVVAVAAVGTLLGAAPAASVASEVSIVAPSPGSVESTSTPVFRGTGTSDAEVTVYDREGAALCVARVSGGSWSCRSGRPMGDGSTRVTAQQIAPGDVSSADLPIVIDTSEVPEGFPLHELIVAGLVVMLGSGVVVSTVLHVRRRRRLPTAAS